VGVLVEVFVAVAVAVGTGVLLGDGVALGLWVALGAEVDVLGRTVTAACVTSFRLTLHPQTIIAKKSPTHRPSMVGDKYCFLRI
jgi:hypothetical protein